MTLYVKIHISRVEILSALSPDTGWYSWDRHFLSINVRTVKWMRRLRLPRPWLWRLLSSGMWRRVAFLIYQLLLPVRSMNRLDHESDGCRFFGSWLQHQDERCHIPKIKAIFMDLKVVLEAIRRPRSTGRPQTWRTRDIVVVGNVNSRISVLRLWIGRGLKFILWPLCAQQNSPSYAWNNRMGGPQEQFWHFRQEIKISCWKCRGKGTAICWSSSPLPKNYTDWAVVVRLNTNGGVVTTHIIHFLLFHLHAHNMFNTYIYHKLPPTRFGVCCTISGWPLRYLHKKCMLFAVLHRLHCRM